MRESSWSVYLRWRVEAKPGAASTQPGWVNALSGAIRQGEAACLLQHLVQLSLSVGTLENHFSFTNGSGGWEQVSKLHSCKRWTAFDLGSSGGWVLLGLCLKTK